MPDYKNKLESSYAAHLAARKAAGEIADWAYEAVTFDLTHGILKHKCTYTPDFIVTLLDGTVEYHETKGFMREDAAVKVKLAASQHPEARFLIVTYKNKRLGWQYKEIPLAWHRKESTKKLTRRICDIITTIDSFYTHLRLTLQNKL